jgi:HPt (histidine-containing phosphotransfer) domain-containing protein
LGGIGGLSLPPPNDSIRDIEAVLGDDATREIVRLFLADFPLSVLKLGRGGREEQVMIAHGLKSSALHMGAAKLSRRMAALESRLDQPEGAIAPEDLVAAIGEFEEVAPALRKYSGA